MECFKRSQKELRITEKARALRILKAEGSAFER